jgi:phosphoribosylformimino-5-aminoimidazole carboxamide ribotide isomerase
MQVIPALDLLGDDAVRLERGDFERVIFRWPIEEFMSRIVATNPPLIHIVDLQGARDGALRPAVVERCAAVASGIPLQVSGGIRSLDAAREALDAGAARVIVGTAAWESDDALALFARTFGDQLLVAFDVRDGRIAVRGWTESSGLDVDEALAKCRDAGVARLHVTAIDRDGTMSGPDLALYQRACASGIPVVAAGGIRDDDDLDALDAIGCEAAVMGLGYLNRLGPKLES